jgi:hypothetical protein
MPLRTVGEKAIPVPGTIRIQVHDGSNPAPAGSAISSFSKSAENVLACVAPCMRAARLVSRQGAAAAM